MPSLNQEHIGCTDVNNIKTALALGLPGAVPEAAMAMVGVHASPSASCSQPGQEKTFLALPEVQAKRGRTKRVGERVGRERKGGKEGEGGEDEQGVSDSGDDRNVRGTEREVSDNEEADREEAEEDGEGDERENRGPDEEWLPSARGKRLPPYREREGKEGVGKGGEGNEGEEFGEAGLGMIAPAQKRRRTDRGRGAVAGKEGGSTLEAAEEEKGGDIAGGGEGGGSAEGVEGEEKREGGEAEGQSHEPAPSVDLVGSAVSDPHNAEETTLPLMGIMP